MIEKKTRNSNIELLRIILMLMVIGVHYNLVGMGNAFYYTQTTGINISLSYLLESICIVCVDTFVIITGYFLIKKERININKVPKFIIMILFFNIIQYILNIIINKIDINISSFCTQLFAGKWFIIIYLVLYILSPYINKLLNMLSIKEYKKLIIILVLIFILYQTILSYISMFISVVGWSGIIDRGIDKGYTIINFIVLYAIGGYIRKVKYNPPLRKSIPIYLISTLLIFISWYILGHSKYIEYAGNAFYYNNVFVVISSIYIFLIFNRLSIKSKIINYISKHNMAIFILSTSPLLVNLYNLLKVEKYSITNYYVPHFIITCLIIYISSLIIAIIGTIILDNTIFKLIDKGGLKNMFFKKNKKIKVFFIAQFKAGSDKFLSVVKEMEKDENFDVKVIAVPNDINDLTKNEDYEYWYNLFGDITIDAIENGKWFDIEKEKPDYVFIQRPYDALVPEGYGKYPLSQYTKVCYIPYGYSLVNLFDISFTIDDTRCFSIVFGEHDEVNNIYSNKMKQIDDGKKRVSISLGFPSLDETKKKVESMDSAFSKIENKNYLNIVWTPRWTTEKDAVATSFFKYKDAIPKYIKDNKNTNLVFRPHPLAFDHFIEKKLMTKKEVKEYLNQFKENLYYDKSSNYLNTFKDSDVLITDFSSIIMEYFLFKKPIIYTQTGEYNKLKVLEKLEDVFYKVKNEKELYKVLDNLQKGIDPLKEKREKLAKELYKECDGQVANRIKEYIKEDYKSR